ncbi:hypothetical protein BLA29_001353, partial [Euroglyphus maynei]
MEHIDGDDIGDGRPQQIHLSLGLTWTTYPSCTQPIVKYGLYYDRLKTAIGNCTEFIDGGRKQRKHYIHRVRLANLEPSTQY